MPSLNLVGCGRVGQTLAHLFHHHGLCDVVDVMARRQDQADDAIAFIGAGRAVTLLADMRPADIWLLTVSDTQIAPVAQEIAASRSALSKPSVAVHCSGFQSAATMTSMGKLGWQLASAHPAQTFASREKGVHQFAGTPCGLEGDPLALKQLRPLLTGAGARCFDVATEHKALYHGAAVIASNFLVVLQSLAREAWAAAGVPQGIARDIQHNILSATVDNVLQLGPRAITGPAARGDTAVIQAQGKVIARWHPEAGDLYQQLSVLARRLAVHETTLPTK